MRQVLLLRGINLGSRNRLAMGELRDALAAEPAFEDVRTHLQSGNVVLSSSLEPAHSAHSCELLIERRLGLSVRVLARTAAELEDVVAADPLGAVAADPKLHLVTFMNEPPAPQALAALDELLCAPEQLAVVGRELYTWHPLGIARSKLWNAIAGARLGIAGTARNWGTLTRLLAIAREEA